MKQRISSWLLVLCMVLALLPVTQLPAAAVASDSGRTTLTASSTTLSGGTYYLAGDVNLSKSIEVTGTVTLDLNGHVLKMTGNDSVIKVQKNGTLTLIDSNPTATNTVGGETIFGGVITGGKATNGSGVYVASGGKFVANGGVVAKDNSVYVASGGTITNNTTSEELTKSGMASATVFFLKPVIEGTQSGDLVTFKIGSSVGFEISHDSWNGEDYAWEIIQQGGYPVNPDSRYAWYGIINERFYPYSFYSPNSPSSFMTVNYSTLYADSNIQSLKKSDLSNGTLSLEPGKSYKLNEDISISSAITISVDINAAAIVLDLNGHVLKMTGNDSVIILKSVSFTLIDSKPTSSNTVDGKTISGGVITGGKAANGGGVYVDTEFVMNGGTIVNCSATNGGEAATGGGVWAESFTMNGGKISGCSATNGGGVWVNQFVMNGGKISGCSATNGGGVCADSFTMNGGEISGCSATNGGGVWATGERVTGVGYNVLCTMNGGKISGGMYVSVGKFTMNGGAIDGNLSLLPDVGYTFTFFMNGGVIGKQGGSFQVNERVTISNTAADSATICYYTNFPSTAKLATDNYLVTFKDGSSTYAYEVVKKGGKAVEVETTTGYGWYNGDTLFDFDKNTVSSSLTLMKTARSYTITYVLNGGINDENNPKTYKVTDTPIVLYDPSRSGYNFTGWTGSPLPNGQIPNGKTGNLTYTANWEEKSSYTVVFTSDGGTVQTKNDVKWTDKILDGVTAPSKPGYTFQGWTYNGNAVGTDTTYGSLVPNDDTTSITLTANWEEKSSYTIEFDSTGGTDVTTKTDVKWTDKVLDGVTAPSKPGYTFQGWTYNGNAVGTDTTYGSLVPNDDTTSITLTANWEEKSNYEVVFDSKNGTEVEPKKNVKWTDRVLDGVEHPRRVDWEFKGWTLNGQPVTAESTYGELVGDEHDEVMSITLTAEWLYAPACSFIEATAGEGGSISPAGFSVVLDGNDKTFTITADSGYLIADVLVDGESVGAVSTYTFTDVRVDHTIEAKFELVQFEDCTEDDWFYPDIIYVAANGIMRGTGSGEFSPDVLTTRGMLVTMLYRLDGEPEVSGSCRFSDVQAGSYCEAAVIWASENGIVNGYDNGLFGTNDAITREQLAVILYRYAEFKGLDVSAGEDTDLLSYSDASETAGYALPAMKWMCGVGILHGNDNNQLMPKGSATRAEVAAILHRFCENILK